MKGRDNDEVLHNIIIKSLPKIIHNFHDMLVM